MEKSEFNYFDFEISLKEYLTNCLEIACIESEVDIHEKFIENAKFSENITWVLNVNTVFNNRGEISSSSLQKVKIFLKYKFYYKILGKIDSDDKKEKIFLIEKNFMKTLHQNIKDTEIINDFISKFEINNNYLNIFLKEHVKDFVLSKEKNKSPSNNDNQNETFTFQSIGYLESCFPEKFSVPRQGNLLELTRGRIVLNKNIDLSCIEGLETFEYIWVIYVFHLHKDFTKTKISPPKYTGNNKLGIYATRTPHRINPIGMTLCRITKIEENKIYLNCVDMVNETPILDIKPYHHLESIDISKMKYPNWILDADKNETSAKVIFEDKALDDLDVIMSEYSLKFYDKKEDIIDLIKGILEIDPHSKYTMKKKEKMLYAFYIDKLNVIYDYDAVNKEVIVVKINYSNEYKKLRNKEWLNNLK